MTLLDGSHDAEPAGGVNPNLSRRQLLTGAAGISVGALVGSTPAFARRAVFARSVMADESTVEGRALAGLKKLIADKKLKSGTTFTVMIPGGSQTNVVPSFQLLEKLTGIKVKTIQVGDLGQIHTKAIQEATAKTGTPDGILHMANWNGDFAEAGLIAPLDEWVQKYNPQMNDRRVGYVQPLGGFTTRYRGHIWALDHDDDSFTYFYRSDLFNDPKQKAQFEDKYGFALKPADTWDQFDKIAAFFTRPSQGYYGAFLFGNRAFAYVNWAARFHSRGGIYMNRDMEPQIASDIGITALEEMVPVTRKYMPPEAVTGDWTALYQAFPAGKAVQATSWISLGKFANDPKNSKIAGHGVAAVMPGSKVKGKLFRAAPHVVGWTWSVSRHGKNPEAMYLIAQWLTGPSEGAKTITRVGILDAYRINHFSDPKVIKAYGKGVIPPLLANTKVAFPDIGIRGGTEYLDALNSNLQDAYAGRKKPETALKAAAKTWNQITDRLDRDVQTEAWRAELRLYPPGLKAAWKLVGQKA